MKQKGVLWKRLATLFLVAVLLVLTGALLVAYAQGQFDSQESFRAYISSFGVFAPVMLTLFQAGQVVIPVLPGFLGCAAGAALFGAGVGFACNYIGICLGSVIAYFLARRYGVALVKCVFPQKTYDKWERWIARWRFYPLVLFVATLLPLFPDDFFCYFSGLTPMRARRFIWIILLGKPWCILAYSLAFSAVL
jgi:uncharacterized membrane protein YdjX (TVP38/TMEM64 family)